MYIIKNTSNLPVEVIKSRLKTLGEAEARLLFVVSENSENVILIEAQSSASTSLIDSVLSPPITADETQSKTDYDDSLTQLKTQYSATITSLTTFIDNPSPTTAEVLAQVKLHARINRFVLRLLRYMIFG